jgi:hypothetical protein
MTDATKTNPMQIAGGRYGKCAPILNEITTVKEDLA